MTYPIDMPLAPKLSELSVLPESVTARSQSPFTLAGQTVVWQGKRYRFTCTTPIMRKADAQKWQAFFASLNGREGTFLFQPSLFCLNNPSEPYLDITPPVGSVDSSGITTSSGEMMGTIGAEGWGMPLPAAGKNVANVLANLTGRTCSWTGTAVRITGHTSKITTAGLPWTVEWGSLGSGTEAPIAWPRLNGQGNGGEIDTDGWTPSELAVSAGQWITIGGRMYQCLSEVYADGAGEATLLLFPHLSAVADNTEIKYGEPATAAFRLDQDAPEFIWRTDKLMEPLTFTIIPDNP